LTSIVDRGLRSPDARHTDFNARFVGLHWRLLRSGAGAKPLAASADSKPFLACDTDTDAHLLAATSVLFVPSHPSCFFLISADSECPETSVAAVRQRRHRDRAVRFTLEVRRCRFLRAHAALMPIQLAEYLFATA
jgi:hypothetical protein